MDARFRRSVNALYQLVTGICCVDASGDAAPPGVVTVTDRNTEGVGSVRDTDVVGVACVVAASFLMGTDCEAAPAPRLI